jgi:type II restriction/modification system DNA methylase subunit YeeA
MNAAQFAEKWKDVTTSERASAQSHFNDLCEVLGHPKPHDVDPNGDWFAFEKGAEKLGGGDGWADVWKRGHFGWEYKGIHKDLEAAYVQLQKYRESLENPPLLVVCDLHRFEVHTNFTNTAKVVHRFTIEDLATNSAEALRVLRAVFTDPAALRPEKTPEQITEEAASRFADIAGRLSARGHHPEAVAHFLNRILFCLFAEDVGLLPRGLLTGLIDSRGRKPPEFAAGLREIFALMAVGGGYWGNDRIDWFNGGLFEDDTVIELDTDELKIVRDAAQLDWSQVAPAILGTLFVRGLDPSKRGQLGAQYTDYATIMRVVEPVVMTPLRREFAALKARVDQLREEAGAPVLNPIVARRQPRSKWQRDAEKPFFAFLERLRAVRVLDPACGSGNFLYVTLRLLKDLEKEAMLWGAEALRMTMPFPEVGPHNLLGIDINPYAAELARVSIWIGHIQWMIDNGFAYERDPILKPLDNIECRDAILTSDAEGNPAAASWPDAEFIVGNPPFLGGKLMRRSLGDEYVDRLFIAWHGAVPREADLVVYWHEKARTLISTDHTKRAGLLATNSIRGGANRRVLERVKKTGDIFVAWSDEPWIVEGAAVRVSIVAQDNGSEVGRVLDGRPVAVINSDLTGGDIGAVDLSTVRRLRENLSRAFMGDTKGGPFDVSGELAREILTDRRNVTGRSNAEVIVPWVNGLDITRRPRGMFIIDFGARMGEGEAAYYERPFEYVRSHIRDIRASSKTTRAEWWIHERPRVDMREALAPVRRFIVTPTMSKHRLFIWERPPTLPDHQLIAIARDDDYTFGVLHSRPHELWSLGTGTWLGKGNDPRYTPTSTFETFPFPWPLNKPDDKLTADQTAHRDAIAAAARALNEARERWLNPPEWVREEPDVVPELPPRLVPLDEEAEEALKKRTLTNLYNERPTWLANLHAALDAAVFAAYGWPEPPDQLSDQEILARLLKLNLERDPA